MLTGYSLEELNNIKASKLFTKDCLERVKNTEDALLRGEALGRLPEVKMIKKDSSEASVQLSTSPVFSSGQQTPSGKNQTDGAR